MQSMPYSYPKLSSDHDRRETQVEPGKPDQFCTLMDVIKHSPISVAPYPVAWRVEIVDDIKHRGFEYVR